MQDILLVRRNPRHAVIAHIQKVPNGIRLEKITPNDGPMPKATGLVGRVFLDKKALRNNVKEGMREVVSGDIQDVGDRVLISRDARKKWYLKLKTCMKENIDILDVIATPRENARVEKNGQLTLYCETPAQEITLTIDQDQWAWMSS